MDDHRAARVLQALLTVVVLSLVVASGARARQPVGLHCGQTITQDTTLANDLRDCPGVGIVVGADDVTLDLGGHVVDGDGAGDAAGIQSVGHDRITIRNGAIRDFVEGVAVLDTTGTTITDLAISRQRHVGVFLAGADDVVVERTASRDIAYSGVFVTGSANVRVLDNAVSDSGGGFGTRVSHDLVVAGNTVSDSREAGIALFDEVQRVQIAGNTVTGGHDAGIFVDGDGSIVTDNLVTKNWDNIVVTGDDDVVRGNTAVKARGFPGEPLSGFGIVIDGGSRNVVEGNEIADSVGDGIRVFRFDPEATQPAGGNVVRGNRVMRSRRDGIFVGAVAPDSLLEDNRSTGNGDDGIDVEAPSSTLTGNVATDNRDLGIEAVLGVTDGGGNSASGNGNPLQCTNVFCN
jgi:nitrous oxidase accessory protein NosD